MPGPRLAQNAGENMLRIHPLDPPISAPERGLCKFLECGMRADLAQVGPNPAEVARTWPNLGRIWQRRPQLARNRPDYVRIWQWQHE